MAVHRLQDSSAAHAGAERTPAESEKLKAEVAAYKAEAERVSTVELRPLTSSGGRSGRARHQLSVIDVLSEQQFSTVRSESSGRMSRVVGIPMQTPDLAHLLNAHILTFQQQGNGVGPRRGTSGWTRNPRGKANYVH